MTAALASPLIGHAEKADANQPTHIEADRMSYVDLKQTNTFTGNVQLTKGTLKIKGQKIIIRQSPSGYQYGTVYGKPAYFRQKRDGGPNLWVRGQAERIEYDTESEILRFYNKAQLKRLKGNKLTDEVEGAFILYNSRTEYYSVSNKSAGKSRSGDSRIKVVIQPNKKKGKSK